MKSARHFQKPFATHINYKHMNFLIMDSPSQDNVHIFAEECKRLNVSDVVRVCESHYTEEAFKDVGINLWHWEFSDGSPPPSDILEKWFHLLKDRFNSPSHSNGSVAVHCIAGFGRAPVLVAVALMELGMHCEDAIEMIRSKRKGSFNERQISYLTHYRAKSRLKQSQKCFIL